MLLDLARPMSPVASLVWSCDDKLVSSLEINGLLGNVVLSGASMGEMALWDLSSAEPSMRFPFHTRTITAVQATSQYSFVCESIDRLRWLECATRSSRLTHECNSLLAAPMAT